MHVHAGTVIGGFVLRSRPQAPRAISPASVGSSPRQRSKTRAGAAESSPTISSFGNVMRAPEEPACSRDARGWQTRPTAPLLRREGAAGAGRQAAVAAEVGTPHEQ